MPELPDVETFTRYFNRTAVRKKVADIKVNHKKILDGGSEHALRSFKGKSFVKASRYGKYLFAPTKNKQDEMMYLHFGMTGYLEYGKQDQLDTDHDRMDIFFQNGNKLAFSNQRMLGRAGKTQSIEKFRREKDLGPDAMDIEKQEFISAFKKTRGKIKSALMNQSLLAGIGNVYSDEILFQAGIFPGVSPQDLSAKQLGTLHTVMRRVLRVTVRHQADPRRFPRGYLTRYREEGRSCPGKCPGKIKTAKFSGRTAYFCPHCQPQKI
ncbi:MAG: Fpg/Nei family DNA glycosylase [Candidatus Omnitrophota bacterium]